MSSPWAKEDCYYSNASPPRGRTRLSETEQQLLHLLTEFDPELKPKIERAFKKWNLVIREHVRSETGLKLSVGEELQFVPVRIRDGVPKPFAEVIQPNPEEVWLLLHRGLLERTEKGLDAVLSEGWLPLQRRLLDESEFRRRDIESTRGVVALLVERAKKLEVIQRIRAIEEDILGAYFLHVPEVHLYWMVIGLIAAAMAVPVEGLTVVVLTHELAHAYSHLGRDIDGKKWETNAFAGSELEIIEGLAQFYTEVICGKLEAKLPEAKLAFTQLLAWQSGPYRVHESWVPDDPNRGEIVRATMIECRLRRTSGYSEFSNRLSGNAAIFGAAAKPSEN